MVCFAPKAKTLFNHLPTKLHPRWKMIEQSIRSQIEQIYRAAVAAVDPARLVGLAIDGRRQGAEPVPDLVASASRIVLLAVGKASLAMAREIERRVGDRLVDAIAVIPRGSDSTRAQTFKKVRVLEASHPVPDESSQNAARLACEMLRRATAADLVIVALSGGASAMFVMPAQGLTLADKVAVNQALLKAGASIRELNTVRKHLSAVKGGRLLRYCGGARVLALILSDVPGNDLATIGSGLTVGDSSSFGDAIAVLKRRDVWGRAPEAVRSYLERAEAGETGATVKPGDPILERVTNVIIGDSSIALEGAERAAAELGYRSERVKEMRGEANDVGRALASSLCAINGERLCVIAGGEPVVTVRGGGKGGRAQQCALAIGIELSQIGVGRRIAVLVAGTDGIDGPTDAAGAFASPETVADGERAGVSAATALTRNDAYNFFKASGGLLITGPTGTNVSDLFIGLVNY
jgi:glycerate 2-kinase